MTLPLLAQDGGSSLLTGADPEDPVGFSKGTRHLLLLEMRPPKHVTYFSAVIRTLEGCFH